MASVDVTKVFLDSISQISNHIEDSILYLDVGCTESFQFVGAFPLLLELGARAVCSLENMTSLDAVVDWNSRLDPPTKILVITSRLLSDAHRYILRCLRRHQGVRCCTIFTSISEMDLKMEIFSFGDLSKAVGKILTDMSSLYDVGRRKRSAGLLLVDRTLDILTPCCHGDSLVDRMFSSLPRREKTTSYSQTKGAQAQHKLVSCGLQRSRLDVQIPLAEILSEEDSKINYSRLLESIEAFLCGWDSHNSTSQVVDLKNLSTKVHDGKYLCSDIPQLTGSFVSTESFRGTPYLEAILDRRTKDGAVLVKKLLQEALLRENITVNIKTRPGIATKSELQSMIKALAKDQSTLLRNKGIIQLAAAALIALDEPYSARWDAFISAEKILSVNAGDTSQSLASQIGDLVNKSALIGSHVQKNGKMDTLQGLLCFQDALLLTIVGYILAGENFSTSGSGGPFSWQEEHFLKEAIVDAILENPSIAKLKFLNGLTEELEANLERQKSEEAKAALLDQLDIDDFDDDQWGKWGEENDEDDKSKEKYNDMQLKLELRDRVDSLFKFLHKLSALKRKNLPLREGSLTSESNFIADPYTSKGFLYKLLTRVLGKYDVPGLEYHSSTVGRFFKSGFGRFGLGQTKPTLADQNVILVFVIGGINAVEVREAREALSESERPDIEFLLGGTTLLTPQDMLDLLLGDSSYI
ncbi:sec1 family domain-containing protein MIP3 isoform X2 [Tripterygium wilfordii]|uniref:sec1 family domain-containing protein MIP3 isoform X2 n=1 Tax=Tripterygium wilfordii TaxID=458696 RepID=UPI0018F81AFE|nr:sec1 family domain-containing protein MIP3 isoform X2 [Tripterygium wilfordii]